MPDPEAAPATVADSAAAPASRSPMAAEPVAEAPVPETAAAPPEPSKTDLLVDLWFAECVQGTVIGRYTDAYNEIYAAKDELKRRLAKET